jgi:hypothetical protein
MNSAGEEVSLEKMSVEEVALQAVETPDTGAETWVLLLGTLIINSLFYFSRRKQSSLAL